MTEKDDRLELLIALCVENGNYKKLNEVGLSLVDNTVNDIGVKLGLRARNKNSNETISEYVRLINNVIWDNLKFYLIPKLIADTVYVIEAQVKRRKGRLSKEHTIRLFDIYYELLKINVPNLNTGATPSLLDVAPEVRALSFLSPGSVKPNKKVDVTRSMLATRLRDRERQLQSTLSKSFNGAQFKEAVLLKGLSKSISVRPSKKKTSVEGSLTNNLIYKGSMDDIAGYFLLSGALVLFLLGLATLIESASIPFLSMTLSAFCLLFFGAGASIFLAYCNYFVMNK